MPFLRTNQQEEIIVKGDDFDVMIEDDRDG